MPYIQQGLPYASGSGTSRDAAVRAQAFSGPQARLVLSFIRHRGSATQKEADQQLGIGRPSCCGRFFWLEEQGLIGKTKFRRDGCTVYVALGEW